MCRFPNLELVTAVPALPQRTLKVIRAPLVETLPSAPPALELPNPTVEFTCGNCGAILIRGDEEKVYPLVVLCNSCGSVQFDERLNAGRRYSAALLPVLMRSHSVSTNSSKFLQKFDLRTLENSTCDSTVGSGYTGRGRLSLPHVPQSVSGHLDQDIRAPAQAKQGLHGKCVRSLIEEAAGGDFIVGLRNWTPAFPDPRLNDENSRTGPAAVASRSVNQLGGQLYGLGFALVRWRTLAIPEVYVATRRYKAAQRPRAVRINQERCGRKRNAQPCEGGDLLRLPVRKSPAERG